MKMQRKIIIFIIIVLLVLITLFASLVWLFFYDIHGLMLYNNEAIREVCFNEDCFFFITDDGYGYVAGNYSESSSRKYRNLSRQVDSELEIPSPVRFFDDKVLSIMPNESGCSAFFITSKYELYKLTDFAVTKIADNVKYVEQVAWTDSMQSLFLIDASKALIYMDNGEFSHIASDIKQVQVCGARAYALRDSGDLVELAKDDVGGWIIGEDILMSNVVCFDIYQTSKRYIDGKITETESSLDTPLINALTSDGVLYARGAYNILECGINLNWDTYPQPHILEDWTMIGAEVSDYSCAEMGTVILFKDGRCAYYGYNTDYDSNTIPEFEYVELSVGDAVNVYCEQMFVCLIDYQGVAYIWGKNHGNVFTHYDGEGYDIFKDKPLTVQLNYVN